MYNQLKEEIFTSVTGVTSILKSMQCIAQIVGKDKELKRGLILGLPKRTIMWMLSQIVADERQKKKKYWYKSLLGHFHSGLLFSSWLFPSSPRQTRSALLFNNRGNSSDFNQSALLKVSGGVQLQFSFPSPLRSKNTQEHHVCRLAINKGFPSFRKIGKLC